MTNKWKYLLKLSLFAAFFLVALPPMPLSAAEKLLSFDVQAHFERDGRMVVRERIAVQAEGDAIKRGIVRELPLSWKRPDGRVYRLSYEIFAIMRNGEPEKHQKNSAGDTLSLRMGNPNHLLEPGRHEYSISYRVRNHFSRFDDWDELYWNVTGNDWPWTIEQASFTLFLPDAAAGRRGFRPGPFRSVEFYTGYKGERKQGATVEEDGKIRLTAPLEPGQGLTVVYTWDKSILASTPAPLEWTSAKRDLVPSDKTWPLFAGPLCMLLFFVWNYLKLRPQGRAPVTIPLFRPPAGLTPGALRYAVKGRYDGHSFAADLLDLVSRGFMALDKSQGRGATPTLLKPEGDTPPPSEKNTQNDALRRINLLFQDHEAALALLKPEEDTPPPPEKNTQNDALTREGRRVIKLLFRGKQTKLALKRGTQNCILKAREYLDEKNSLQHPLLFVSCQHPLLIGSLMAFICPLHYIVFFLNEAVMSVIFIMLIFIPSFIFSLILFTKREIRLNDIRRLPQWIYFLFFWVLILMMSDRAVSPNIPKLPEGFLGAMLLSLALPPCFYLAAPKRSALGLERLALARGLIMYMRTAEEKRYEAIYPPLADVEQFERLLPFALALGVGKTWAGTFARFLEKSGLEAHNFKDFSWDEARHFSRNAARASTARFSSDISFSGSSSGSGSGGGGSSGGGSGGGGGRGW